MRFSLKEIASQLKRSLKAVKRHRQLVRILKPLVRSRELDHMMVERIGKNMDRYLGQLKAQGEDLSKLQIQIGLRSMPLLCWLMSFEPIPRLLIGEHDRATLIESALKHGVSPMTAETDPRDEGWNAVHWAVKMQFMDVLSLLMKHDGDLSSKTTDKARRDGWDLAFDTNQLPMMEWAMRQLKNKPLEGRVKKIEQYIQRQGYISLTGISDSFFLFFLNNGLSVNFNLGAYRGQKSLLHEMAQTGRLTMCQELVLRGADVKAKNDEGQTPLESANSSVARETRAYLEQVELAIHEKEEIESCLHLAPSVVGTAPIKKRALRV